MNFNDYQKEALKTFVNNNNTRSEILARLALGLVGEAAEVAEKIKKKLRGDYNHKLYSFNLDTKKEIGDLCWYIANLTDFLDLDFNEILENNIKKLKSRKDRGKIKGSGDER